MLLGQRLHHVPLAKDCLTLLAGRLVSSIILLRLLQHLLALLRNDTVILVLMVELRLLLVWRG